MHFGKFAANPVRLVAGMVALALGFLAPLHIAGILGILFGLPLTRAAIIAGCLVGTIAMAGSLRFLQIPAHSWLTGSSTRFLRVMLAAILALYAILFASSWSSFPDGYDANQYHLSLALQWLQTASLDLNPALGWQYSFPSNAELPALFAFAAGLPAAVDFGNIFSALLLFSCVYLIAFRVTGEGEPSLLAAAIVSSMPMFLFQAIDVYVDLLGTAFILASGVLLLWLEDSPAAFGFLSGYALGVAIGSKPVFWVYAVLLAPVIVTALIGTRRRLLAATLHVGGILAGCGFWFFRAARVTGNPIFPLTVPPQILAAAMAYGSRPTFWACLIAGTVGVVLVCRHISWRGAAVVFLAAALLAGGWFLKRRPDRALAANPSAPGYSLTQLTSGTFVDYSPAAFLIVWRLWSEETFLSDVPVGPDRGTGPLFAAIVVPGILFLVLQAARREIPANGTWLLVLILATALSWMFVLHQIPRFAMPGLAVAAAGSGPMLSGLLRHARKTLIVTYSAGLLLIVLFCLALPAHSLLMRGRMHDWSRATYYGYPPVIDHLPSGSRILNHTQSPAAFPLAGATLTNRVLPESGLNDVDYVVKVGAEDKEDDELKLRKSSLIYDAEPRSLHPNLPRRWRVYRVRP